MQAIETISLRNAFVSPHALHRVAGMIRVLTTNVLTLQATTNNLARPKETDGFSQQATPYKTLGVQDPVRIRVWFS